MCGDLSPHSIFAALAVVVVLPFAAAAELSIRQIQVTPSAAQSRVPAVTAQGRTLSPQAVSCVNISADGKFITVGTMAFSHDANVWQFAPDGTVLAKRHLPPWAPMQVATLNGGSALAVGLAYSRVTSPEPTVWSGGTDALLREPWEDTLVEADTRDSELARLRPGAGDWRTGWFASHLGELFVHGPDWAFKPPGLFLHADGTRIRLRYGDKNQLPTSRATRMTVSRDGKRAAFGWLSLNQSADPRKPRQAVSVWSVNPNRPLWSAAASEDLSAPALPQPAADFPELGKDGFRLAADAVVPATVSAAVALSGDGSRVALVEYAAQVWTRTGPAIGKWDPPIHTLNFVPTQRGRLRVFDGNGKELLREWLPEAGLFEVGFGGEADAVWCWPASWFARGMAGDPWLPVQAEARTVYRVDIEALGVERVTHVLHTHSHGDHAGGAHLWRAAGAKIVGPKSAALTLTWLMPMLTDYGIFPPRPLDVPLPLARVGDETELTVSGQKFRALFVPGHSFDLTVYMTELGGKRVAFTGDLGFERESDIVHRCWGDAEKARPVIKAIREKLLAWKPDVVFTGHGVRPNGTEWVQDLLRRSEESLAKAAAKGESK
jgi:glyoxylase-like metal-dependent hydrolase (beta-lactamase superfamily II)